MSENVLQPPYLIAPPDLDELLGHASFNTPEHGPCITDEHERASHDVRSLLHLVRASKHLEPGMAAKQIILLPVVEQPPVNPRMLPATHAPMVQAHLLVESPGLPA